MVVFLVSFPRFIVYWIYVYIYIIILLEHVWNKYSMLVGGRWWLEREWERKAISLHRIRLTGVCPCWTGVDNKLLLRDTGYPTRIFFFSGNDVIASERVGTRHERGFRNEKKKWLVSAAINLSDTNYRWL